MGKGGKPKVEVTEYYMSEHFGICNGPVDALLGLTIKEKPAWSGRQTDSGSFAISDPELFGGVKKEGGIAGLVTYLPGAGDQLLPDALAQRLGRADGADCPGFRGIASLFFTGGANVAAGGFSLAEIFILVITKLASRAGQAGFYWTANTPYLPGVWCKVRRAPVGLDPAIAMIPVDPDEDLFPTSTLTSSHGAGKLAFTPDYSLLLAGTYDGFAVIPTATVTITSNPSVAFGLIEDSSGSMAILSDGTILAPAGAGIGIRGFSSDGTDLGLIGDTSGVTVYDVDSCQDSNGVDHWLGIDAFATEAFNFDGVTHQTSDLCGTAFHVDGIFADSFGAVWISGQTNSVGSPTPSDTAIFHRIFGPGDGPDTVTVSGLPSASTWVVGHHYADATHDQFVFNWNGVIYAADRLTGAIITSNSDGDAVQDKETWRFIVMGATRMWAGFTEIRLSDLTTVRTLDPNDWGWSSGVPATVYDPINRALVWSSGNDVHWAYLDHIGPANANPAHIIYECLTNTSWGMGSPPAALDFDAFSDAAQTLYDEGFGLSMIWTRQSSIQDFVQEVLDHIQAVLYVDPSTGLLTLTLIRGDYDPDELPVLTPSNADLTSFSRKLWCDIVNEIIVTWTNPENEQEETITVQDDSSIATQGGPVSDSRNYYGVRTAALAQTLAYRDLRSAGQPLATCEAEVDRTQWRLRPASVVKLTWPEYGLSEVVMRVTSIDYGRPGDMTIKLALIEDVYGLDIGTYDTPPSTAWEDPSAAPAPIETVDIFTLPLFFAADTTVSAFVDSPEYPEVLAGVLATTDSTDTFSYELWDQVALPNGSLEWQSLGTNNIIGRGLLVDALEAEAESTDVSFDDIVGQTVPTVGGFVIIGDEGETGNEIAMVEVAGSTYTMTRGVLDTVPRAWPSGTPAWFVDGSTLFEDSLVRSAGETVSYKLRSQTSQGMLDLASAPLESATLSDRPWLPNRPAKVEAYGEAWSSETAIIDARARPDPWVTVTWANRNRLSEDSQVLAWTDATVTPEDGQTTRIEVVSIDGTPLATHDGLSGTSFDVPDASFGGEAVVRLQVYADRSDDDGDFASLQFFEHWVQVAPLTFDSTRVTFDSDTWTMDED